MRRFGWLGVGICFLVAGCGGEDPAADEDEGDGSGLPGAPTGEGDSDWARRVVAGGPPPEGTPREVVTSSELAIMLDARGVPHMAYNINGMDGNELIRHAWLGAAAFEREAVDGSGRGLRKAWVTGASEPRLVYDAPYVTSVAFYATRASAGSWDLDLLEFQDETAGATGLWAGERMVLARHRGLRGEEITGYASVDVVRQGLVFNERVLPDASTALGLEAPPPLLAIGIDGGGVVHMAYAAPNGDVGEDGRRPRNDPPRPFQIRYVTYQQGAFSEPETITEVDGTYAGLSLAIDDADTVHVSFARVDPDGRPASQLSDAFGVALLERAAGASAWQAQQLPDTRGVRLARGSMAVTPGGDAHLVYCTPGSQGRCESVTHAYERDGTWATEQVQRGCAGAGEGATLALGADGSVHATYGGCAQDLIYALRAAP